MIIDLPKSHREIDPQIDQSDEEFQKTVCPAEIPELERDGDQNSEGLGDVLPGSEKLGRPHSKMTERGEKEKKNDPK